ncbi:MAG: HAMP domain-containing sensor histidine kinase [Acidimicrobiia bacterium]|nr:HAMP domain-containing sensor histidine kinase [Acidimicrobiia bacterium]
MASPGVFRSIRFRLAGTYTLVVFTIAALVVGAVYLVFSASLDADALETGLEPRRIGVQRGVAVFIDEGAVASFQALVDRESLDRLRETSLIALGILAPLSFAAGWIIAGRVLRPMGHITEVARDIQASDLSRRIRLQGPDDELKRLADTFDEMLDRVEQGIEDQRKFVADTSHELRNPLATMSLNLDMALDEPDAGPEDLRQTMKVVRTGVDRLSGTVDELMRFARRELRQSIAVRTDLAELVRETAAEFRAAAAARSVGMEVEADPAVVRTDQEALRSAVANLAANAVRIAPEGGTVRIGSGVAGDWAWAGVHDDGPGIDEDLHRLVFHRNWSTDGSDLSGEPRSGLGLAIVRQITEASGGRVTVASEPGSGSSFVVWLPRREKADPTDVTVDGIHPVADPFG